MKSSPMKLAADSRAVHDKRARSDFFSCKTSIIPVDCSRVLFTDGGVIRDLKIGDTMAGVVCGGVIFI